MAAIDAPGVLAALTAIRAEAHRLERGHGYPAVSVRSLATKLGHAALLPQVLQACADGGFWYCLDYTVPSQDTGEYPAPSVCLWGPDQLRSRLDVVDWRVRPR